MKNFLLAILFLSMQLMGTAVSAQTSTTDYLKVIVSTEKYGTQNFSFAIGDARKGKYNLSLEEKISVGVKRTPEISCKFVFDRYNACVVEVKVIIYDDQGEPESTFPFTVKMCGQDEGVAMKTIKIDGDQGGQPHRIY